MDKIYISWEEFHKDTKSLCEKIKASGSYDKIIAVSRGGLVPAGIVSYELGLRNVETVNVRSYDDGKEGRNDEVIYTSNVGEVNEKTLVIDDLSDTGNTFRLLKGLFPQAKFITVYAKPEGVSEPDIFEKKLPDKWIVFPWD
ncbi:MAG: xanthine phosphoribosyltransferase [Lactobacillaceae bacterium]|jgi:xanthine phosphoribosyltransferase|nr:xanthine phosphoribosyltransferase [Lactobacillaceae bacterium]